MLANTPPSSAKESRDKSAAECMLTVHQSGHVRSFGESSWTPDLAAHMAELWLSRLLMQRRRQKKRKQRWQERTPSASEESGVFLR